MGDSRQNRQEYDQEWLLLPARTEMIRTAYVRSLTTKTAGDTFRERPPWRFLQKLHWEVQMTYEKPEVRDFGPIADNTYAGHVEFIGGPSGDNVVDSLDI